MPKKLTIELIIEEFKKHNLELLTKVYKDNKQVLIFKCAFGKEHSTTWNRWSRSKVKTCKCAKDYNRTLKQYNKVKYIIEDKGGKLLTKIDEYKTNQSKVHYICCNNHSTEGVTFGSVLIGHWCRKCADVKHSKNMVGDGNSNFKDGAKKFNLASYTTYVKKLNSKGIKVYKKESNGIEVVGLKCCYCGGIFVPKLCTVVTILQSQREVFCSNTCSGKYAALNRDLTGSNNPNWQGGLTLQPYCTMWQNKEFKSYIRERDNNICQNPYCYGVDTRLTIHHIDYHKKNCTPSNLITVCSSCNSRANTDREWHTEWYNALINKKYKY